MLTKEQAEKIAAAANAHRPDWSVPQLMGVLGKDDIRLRRTYRDTAIAMCWVATDSDSRQPTRILADGPWWELTRPMAPIYNFPADGEACVECGQTSERHHAPAYADHPWTNRPQPTPKPEETP